MGYMTAKYDGTCVECGAPIEKGEKIYFWSGNGAYHPNCIEYGGVWELPQERLKELEAWYNVNNEEKTISFADLKAKAMDTTKFYSSNANSLMKTVNSNNREVDLGNLTPEMNSRRLRRRGYYNRINSILVNYAAVLAIRAAPVNEGRYTLRRNTNTRKVHRVYTQYSKNGHKSYRLLCTGYPIRSEHYDEEDGDPCPSCESKLKKAVPIGPDRGQGS